MKISILLVVIFTIFYSCSVYKKKEIASKELTNEVNKIYNDSIFNGFAISIVNEKGILYENGFGFSDISTKQKYTEKTPFISQQLIKKHIQLMVLIIL